jgi:hypothetical protein
MDAGPPGRLPVSVWIPNPEGLGNFQGLKSMAEEWEWFVQKIPEGLHVYSNGTQMYHSIPCGVALFFASGYFYKHLIPLESCDGTEVHTRLGTELHNCYGTGLGSRNTVASQPVHPPEWERYARRKTEVGSRKTEDRGPKTEVRSRKTGVERRTAAAPRNICSNEFYPLGMKVHRTETLNGNMECKIRKTEVGSRKMEPERKCRILNNQYPMMNEEYRITNNESGKKVPVRGQLIPEGLHVYRPISRENTTPAGVERLSAPWYFYKHLMPLASGRTS